MKKLLLILLCFTTACAIAQRDTSFRRWAVAKADGPLYVINNKIIVSDINHIINPINIKQIKVIKDISAMPANLKNLGKYGVVCIYTKTRLKTKTHAFKDFKNWLGITDNIDYALDGFYVDDVNLRVAVAAINEINIIRPTHENKLTHTLINIWTLEPAQRNGIHHIPQPGDRPGQIYIRGNILR